MSRFYENVRKAPLMYIDANGEFKKTTVVAIKGVNIPNSFEIPYVRGAVGLFNMIISRMMYWAVKEKVNGRTRERQYPKAQEYIYLPAHQISNTINRCESQSYNIIRSLERILGIHVQRAHEQHGANTIRLSDRVHEFLHIFTPGKLNDFIEKYNIDPVDQYALKQLYNYRVVRPSDSNMNLAEKKEFDSFIKSRRHRNFLHFCAQNNVDPQSRVEEIELHIDLLSDKQLEQLNTIKTYLKQGITKLANYFHWKLIDLQQFITLMLKKASFKATESNQDRQSPTNSESNLKETAEHAAATRVAQRKPVPEPTPGEIIEIIASWNNEMRGQDNIPTINNINTKTYNAICNQVKSYGKDTILSSIRKVTGLHAVSNGSYQMTFSKFMTKKTIDIILASNLTEDIQSDWFADAWADRQGHDIIPRIDVESIPQFDTKVDAIKWWNHSLNS